MGTLDDYLSQVNNASGSVTTGPGGNRLVYMGSTRNPDDNLDIRTDRVTPGPTRPRGTPLIDGDPSIRPAQRDRRGISVRGPVYDDNIQDEASVLGQVYSWYGTSEFDRWGQRLVDLGLLDAEERGNIKELDSYWQEAVDLSARFLEQGKKITPWKAIELLAAMDEDGRRGGGSGGGSGGFTGNRRSTSTSIDLTDPATAKAIVNDALSQRLGRAATDAEVAQFTGVINSAERARPTVTTSDTTYDDGVAVSQSSTTTGGITAAGRDQLVADQAMQLPEYGAYQAASTYFNAFVNSLASPV